MLHVPVLDLHRSLASKMFSKCSEDQKLKILTQTSNNLLHLVHDTADHVRSKCTGEVPDIITALLPKITSLHESAEKAVVDAKLALVEEWENAKELFEDAIIKRLYLHELHDNAQKAVSDHCGIEHEPVKNTIVKIKRPTTVELNEKSRGTLASLYDTAVSHISQYDTTLRLIYLFIILATIVNLEIAGEIYLRDKTFLAPYIESGLGKVAFQMNNIGSRIMVQVFDYMDWSLMVARLGVMITSLLAVSFSGLKGIVDPLRKGRGSILAIMMLLALSCVVSTYTAEAFVRDKITTDQVTSVLYEKAVNTAVVNQGLSQDQSNTFLQMIDGSGAIDATKVSGSDLEVIAATGELTVSMIGQIFMDLDTTTIGSGVRDLELIDAPETRGAVKIMSELPPYVRGITYFHQMCIAEARSAADPLGQFMRLPETAVSTVLVGSHAYLYATSASVVWAAAPAATALAIYKADQDMQIVPMYKQGRNMVGAGMLMMYQAVVDEAVTPNVKYAMSIISEPVFEFFAEPEIEKAVRRELGAPEPPEGWAVQSDGTLKKRYSFSENFPIISGFVKWYFKMGYKYTVPSAEELEAQKEAARRYRREVKATGFF